MNQFQINPPYKSNGKTSIRLFNILPKQLTLNPNHFLFNEVELGPIDYTEEEIRLFNLPHGTSKYSFSKTKDWIVSKIKAHILENWDKSKQHIFYFYPNSESKLLAAILMQLYKEDDLGQLIFVHMSPETNSFIEFMEYIGWSDFTSIRTEDLLLKAFSKFNKASWINGEEINFNHLTFEILQDKKLWQAKIKPENTQIISSFSYLAKASDNSGNALGLFPAKTTNIYPAEVIAPFLSYSVLESAVKSRYRGNLVITLLEHIDKNLCKFENRLAYWDKPMPGYLKNYLMSEYEQSWYYKSTGLRLYIPDNLNIPRWNYHLILSMLCETLIKQGYVLTLKEN